MSLFRSILASTARPTAPHMPETPARHSSAIVANAEFGHGVSRETTTSYTPTEEEKCVTQPPPLESLPATTPIPLTMFQSVKSALGLGDDAVGKSEDGVIGNVSAKENVLATTDGSERVPVPATTAALTGDGAVLPPPKTAPTVFITSTTASSEPAPIPLITVGPIIGLVTDTTARVLIEANTSMAVTIRCTLVKRNVRGDKYGVALLDKRTTIDKHVTQKGILSPSTMKSPESQPQPQSQQSTSVSGPASVTIHLDSASAASPAPAPIPIVAPAIAGNDAQAATIMSGTSSGSPVAGSGRGPLPTTPSTMSTLSPSPLPSIPQPHHSRSGSGQSGTTVGKAGGQEVSGPVSTESRPSPAIQPSPTEQPQRSPAPSPPPEDLSTNTNTSVISHSQQANDVQCFEKDVECTAHRISTVTFTDLEPDARYEISFTNIQSRVSSSFTTLLSSWPVHAGTPFKFGVVSCNLLSVTKDLELPDSDLWLDLQRRVAAGDIDYVLHIGDQIYADEKRSLEEGAIDKKYQLVFKASVKMLKEIPAEQWPICAQHILELYRQLYRETWSHPPTAFVLANAPSLMIYDDHDFRDDWGNEPCDSDPTSPEYYVGRCAHQVMCEYQRQLWDNVDFTALNSIKKDFHFHVFGEHGLVFLDVRGPRSLHKIENEEYPYLGSLQWQELKDAMSENGVLREVKSLYVICPAPIVFLPTTINDLLGNSVIDDALGHWSSKPFKAEQLMMLDLCQLWKGARPGRELTFVGGDVHVGGHSEITRDGTVIFQQFITSAISNYRLSKFEFFLGKQAQDLITELEKGWGFKHRGFTRQRNYGLIETSADELGPLIRRRHITPKGEKPQCDNRIGIAHLV